jgi:hypothetical protein
VQAGENVVKACTVVFHYTNHSRERSFASGVEVSQQVAVPGYSDGSALWRQCVASDGCGLIVVHCGA